MVFSQDLERQVIGGLIKHQEVYPEVSCILGTEDFAYTINKSIFSVVKHALDNKQAIDPILVATRIKNLGVSFRDEADPTEYIQGLALIQGTGKSIIQAVKDLKVFTLRRGYLEAMARVKTSLMKGDNKSYDEIISYVDKEIYSNLQNYSSSTDPIDLFESMMGRIEELGNNPVDDMGLQTPYECYNKRYGGLRNGNVYVFCSRPKQGKTSLLNSMAFQMSNVISKIPCLILDTEMQTEEIQERVLSMVSGVPTWYITTGNWRKNEEFTTKIRAAWKVINENKYSMFHKYVIGMPVDKVINEIKRWYYTKVGRGNQCLIVYDYIKLTGEATSEHNKEHQVIGEKVNALKELVGGEVKAPLITACQINRSGDNRRQATDDASVISLSDRVLWFASQVSIFRRKTPEELQTETANFGSHKLINIESRWQGREAAGHMDYVKDLDGNIINNFTNFNLDNFQVTERGDAASMFAQLSGNVQVPVNNVVNPMDDAPEVIKND